MRKVILGRDTMEHPDLYDYTTSILWAQYILEKKEEYLLLDTETTGLGEKDVVIQIGVMDLDGNTLIDTLVRPTGKKSISRQATAIHGIRLKDLAGAPTFSDVLFDLAPLIKEGKQFLIYNFDFDARLLKQTFNQEGLMGQLQLQGDCIMKKYSQFIGEWHPYYGDYRRQKLPGASHNAIGDCKAALNVIQFLASAEQVDIPTGYKPASFTHQKIEPEKEVEKTSQLDANKSEDKSQDEGVNYWGCIFAVVIVFAIVIFLGLC